MQTSFRSNISGHNGGAVIAGTTAVTPPEGKVFVELHVITATEVDTIAGNLTDIDDLDGAALPAGAVIPGRFTSVQLASGIVIAVLD